MNPVQTSTIVQKAFLWFLFLNQHRARFLGKGVFGNRLALFRKCWHKVIKTPTGNLPRNRLIFLREAACLDKLAI